jgi:oxalate---CoA ligase
MLLPMYGRGLQGSLNARESGRLTLRQLIAAVAARRSQAVALAAPGRAPLSYERLASHIDAIVVALTALGVTDSRQRVALVIPSGPELAVMSLAVAGSAICVPLNPSYRADEFDFCLSTLEAAAVVAQADLDSPAREAARKHGIPVIDLTPRLEAEAGICALSGNGVEESPKHVDVVPDDIALIQYTSGSTARPKRVLLTHKNVCDSVLNLAAALQLTPQDRCLNLKPIYHGAGLQTMLAALAAGGSVICPPLPDVDEFFVWLDTLRPSWFAATPTTHRAILSQARDHRAPIARCPLRFIRSGTGPLAPDVLRELERVFGVPVLEGYGMTETGEISCPPLPPRPRKYGSVGVTVGPEIATMDENGIPLPAGTIGEVVVRGTSVTQGYEDAPEANAEVFRDGWFRTGDTGVIDTDGYLFLKGRLKDVVNRGGQKVSPAEVEEVLRRHPAVADAVAFPVPHPTLGQDLAAAVVLHQGFQATELDLRLFTAYRLADFKVPRRVLFVDEIPRAPSGKLLRRHLAGGFQPLLRAPFVAPEQPLERALARIWADELETDHIGLNDNFFDLGGDSLRAVRVCARVQTSLGRPLSVAMLFKTPTIAELGRALQRKETDHPGSPLVIIQEGGARPPLFCLHGRSGDVTEYFALARHLGPDQPVYGLQARGIDGTESPLVRIEDMAAVYMQEIQAVFPHGPYLLCGYSVAGLLAWEVAQQLRARSRPVAALMLLDTHLAQNPSFTSVPYSGWAFFTRRVAFHWNNLKKARLHTWPLYAAARLKRRLSAKRVVPLQNREEPVVEPRPAWALLGDEPEKWPAVLLTMVQALWRAAHVYTLRRYPGRVTLFLAQSDHVPQRYDPRLPGRLAGGGLDIRWVPGDHSTMLYEPDVGALAKMLRECLDKAIAPAPFWQNITRALVTLCSRHFWGAERSTR